MADARFLISGKVQGVWFRASTRDQALRLGLRGCASNLADGRVEVLAVGDAEGIEHLANWLQHGPPLARVDVVERRDGGADIEAQADASDFHIR
jgi:acylphosphatase